MTEINIAQSVWRYIDTDQILKKAIAKGIVNKRALASIIMKDLNIKNEDAIISAIRRYNIDKDFESKFTKAAEVISNSKISTKSKIAIIALQKDKELQQELPKLFEIIDYTKGEVLRIIQAEESIKIIIDNKNLEKVKTMFPKNKIIKIHKNIAEINMTVDPDSYKVPGVLSMLTTELSGHEVNIVEAMSCVPELIWFVEEDDILKAHEVLFNLGKAMRDRVK